MDHYNIFTLNIITNTPSICICLLLRGLFDNLQKNHGEFNKAGGEHKAKLSHELIAGAVVYAAVRTYNKHCAENGQPMAKQLLAVFSGGALDKLIETKGLDLIDE